MRYAIVKGGIVQHYADRTSPTAAMASMLAAHGMTASHAFRPAPLDASPSHLVYVVDGFEEGPTIPAGDPVAGFTVTETL